MIEDLSGFHGEDIEKAFLIWRREFEKIPTPAGIIKLVQRVKSERLGLSDIKRLCDFDGDWGAYQLYLKGEE